MTLSKNLLQGIERFLALVPAQTRKRGRSYHEEGLVQKLTCLEPNHLYTAIVSGGEDYVLGLEFAENQWFINCSCPVEFDCKHAVAALLALRQNAASTPSVPEKPALAVKPSPKKAVPRAVQQPPRSPLYERLIGRLGRQLNQEEAGFIRRVQAFYTVASAGSIMEHSLDPITGKQTFTNYWTPIELWPAYPRDDFYCWQYLARALAQRKIAIPEFMQGITDGALIEAELAEWKRKKEIAHWQNWFHNFDRIIAVDESLTLELRLVLQSEEARLQWRVSPTAEFTEFKQAHAKRFAEHFERGALALTPESLPIWSALYKAWQYESWWSFKYANASSSPGLNRLLRLPLAPDRIVTADHQPLVRVSEPLRLELRPPEKDSGSYEIALTTADGSPPPKILCIFHGYPTLYLTARGLFSGPRADALDRKMRQAIPAPALETTDGLHFLHTTGVALPEVLSSRVHPLPMRVTISCELARPYPTSTYEDIVVEIKSQGPGLKPEKFTAQGWQPIIGENAKKQPKLAKDAIPFPDRSAQRQFPGLLDPLGVKWDNYPGSWKLRLNKKIPEIFVAWLKSLPPEIEVLLDRELASLRNEPVSGTVSLDVTESAMDWFDLKVVLNVGDTTLTPEELKLLLNARGGYVRLGKKGWRRLQFNLTDEEDAHLARLGLDAREFSAEPQRFHALQLADESAKKFLTPERVEQVQRRASELKARVSPALPAGIRADLRPYQMDGYHFLAFLTTNRFGGVLADDMGLGKTLQTLAWLALLREPNPDAGSQTINPSLVVCPKSVTDNWRAEAERFYPGLRVRIWRGEPPEELAVARETADLVVINYSQLRFLSPAIASVQWQAAILDEAQYIKNPDSQTAQAARALNADHRLALTGTPIENRLLDLWSILSFAMPGALGNRAHFLRRFNAQDDPLARRRLAARVRPFLLRRTKTQVAKDLPDRVEEDLLCEMEGKQQALYRAELKRARQLILGLKSHQQLNEERFNVLTSLLRLRQICCHPALVDGKLRDAESAKVVALLDLLEPLMEEGHKVLVFSQFVTMLDIIRDTVTERGWPHFYLAGSTENRGELVQEFQSAKGGAVFLISLKAGGFGLNLTAASYVVLFDPWWNPAVENQAIDRTHRIGQTSKVMAYRLLMRDSIEQKIRALQKQKAALMDDVLGEERFSQSLTLDDLRFLFSDDSDNS